jgi:hypothetical protein
MFLFFLGITQLMGTCGTTPSFSLPTGCTLVAFPQLLEDLEYSTMGLHTVN